MALSTLRPSHSESSAMTSTFQSADITFNPPRMPIEPRIPLIDPSYDEEYSTFLHPPFTFWPANGKPPVRHLLPEGEMDPKVVTYALLAANPDWFLDAADFTKEDNHLTYPPHLEPPRGWCPLGLRRGETKVDDAVKTDDARLRCTFCRRTYAGVNAKSMWRRHVYEKHKIAMPNRRESGGDRRGRGALSNKENGPFTGGRNRRGGQRKRRSSSVLPSQQVFGAIPPERPVPAEKEEVLESGEPVNGPISPPASPTIIPRIPQTPELDFSLASDTPGEMSRADITRLLESGIPSPVYDPTRTPTFKHVPQRMPLEQPWRFPSPSHPLHSSPNFLCLTALAQSSPRDAPTIEPESPLRPRQLFGKCEIGLTRSYSVGATLFSQLTLDAPAPTVDTDTETVPDVFSDGFSRWDDNSIPDLNEELTGYPVGEERETDPLFGLLDSPSRVSTRRAIPIELPTTAKCFRKNAATEYPMLPALKRRRTAA